MSKIIVRSARSLLASSSSSSLLLLLILIVIQYTCIQSFAPINTRIQLLYNTPTTIPLLQQQQQPISVKLSSTTCSSRTSNYQLSTASTAFRLLCPNHPNNLKRRSCHCHEKSRTTTTVTKRIVSPLVLTTTISNDEVISNNDDDDSGDGKKLSIGQKIIEQFRLAGDKFKARPVTYMIIPCIAAIVGWFTNWLAVQMIFYPIQFWGIPIWRRPGLPLGFIGWQGIVPCKTEPMSLAIVTMVTSQLLTVQEAFRRLDPTTVATVLSPEIPKIIADIVATESMVPPMLIWLSKVPSIISTPFQPIIQILNFQFVKQLVVSIQNNADTIFNIENCVVNQMITNRAKLGDLFQTVATTELNFLTNSGLWFGFLLGLIQMIVALLYNNPWTLSFGGLIVGLATNWLALKWIFQPIDPTPFGPFLLQGQFLRRQKEVAAIFSNYFATNVLNANEIWKSILSDSSTRPEFITLVTNQLQIFATKATRFIPLVSIPSIPALSTLSEQIVTRLPNHLPVAFPYMETALGLEHTLRTKMELMTSRKFERVLHPIFEEDELTLIIAGAVLGFLAGLIQQGLETGQIQIKVPAFVQNFIKTLRTKFTRNKNNSNATSTDTSSESNDTDDNNKAPSS